MPSFPRRLKIAVILCVSALIAISPSFAHSGRTDSHGGHYDRSTGEYHYHHGYSAHQHENGICPYAMDDKTNHGSGTTQTKEETEKIPSESTTKTNQKSNTWLLIFALILLLPGPAIMGFAFISMKIQDVKEKFEYETKRKQYLKEYATKDEFTIAHECGMPSRTMIGNDGYPRDGFSLDDTEWGLTYTFYVSPSGKTFHRTKTCNPSITKAINAVDLLDRQPCKLCRPKSPDLTWYWKYKNIMKELKKYNVTPSWNHQEKLCGYMLAKSKKDPGS